MKMLDQQPDQTSALKALVVPFLTLILGSPAGCNSQRDDQLVTPAEASAQRFERDCKGSDLVEKVRDAFEAVTPEEKQVTERLVRDCIQLASDSDRQIYRYTLSEELAKHTQSSNADTGPTASEEITAEKILFLRDLMLLCAD
jgi:hypothetical protein